MVTMTKEQAINHLKEREYHFLDKNLFGRTKIMREMRESIENGECTDFEYIGQMGLEFELPPIRVSLLP